jgi:hypothetical protein
VNYAFGKICVLHWSTFDCGCGLYERYLVFSILKGALRNYHLTGIKTVVHTEIYVGNLWGGIEIWEDLW